MRILLFGHDGQVGGRLGPRLEALGPVSGWSFPDVDFRKPDELRRLVRREEPDLIVNAAAYTAVDRAETDPDTARALNTDAPALLAAEAHRHGAALVHYSTDFVFDGAGTRPYTEADEPRPLSVYGKTKLDGDAAVQAVGGRHLIFRLSWVYGLHGKNFLLTMRRLAAERGEVRVVDDQVGCPTWADAVAEATLRALVVLRDGARWGREDLWGLYHMVCSGQTSWCGFARAFLPATVAVRPISTADYPTPARRPPYSVLDCARLRRAFGIDMPSWESALQACLRAET